MEVVGGIYHNEQDLTLAVQGLQDKGFHIYQVIGPEELYRQPGVDDEMEDSLENVGHTDEGTISGITADPGSEDMDEASAQTVADDLRQLGLSDEIADLFVTALHQDKILLLVQTKRGQVEEAQKILEEHGALEVRHHHPEDAIPEEQWRPDLFS